MIDSDTLGKAFEPEARYENPDGTAIRFDTDFLGEHRGTEVIPGPFAASRSNMTYDRTALFSVKQLLTELLSPVKKH